MIVDSIIEFPDGLIGLGGSRYALLSTDADEPVSLASVARQRAGGRCRSPTRTGSSRSSRSSWRTPTREKPGFDDGVPADVYVTVTASSVVTDITVNLKAPILIRDGKRPSGDQSARRRSREDAAVPGEAAGRAGNGCLI